MSRLTLMMRSGRVSSKYSKGDTQKASSPWARALTWPATALSQPLLASMRRAAAILNLMSLVSTDPSPLRRVGAPDSSKNTTIKKSAAQARRGGGGQARDRPVGRRRGVGGVPGPGPQGGGRGAGSHG